MSTIEWWESATEAVDDPVAKKVEYRRETLLRAAELVERHGYAYGSDGLRTEGPYCLLGAVAHAMDGVSYPAVGELGEHYGMGEPANLIGVDINAAFQWNDGLKYERMPRKSLFGPRMSRTEVVASTLRMLANGVPWEEATRL